MIRCYRLDVKAQKVKSIGYKYRAVAHNAIKRDQIFVFPHFHTLKKIRMVGRFGNNLE